MITRKQTANHLEKSSSERSSDTAESMLEFGTVWSPSYCIPPFLLHSPPPAALDQFPLIISHQRQNWNAKTVPVTSPFRQGHHLRPLCTPVQRIFCHLPLRLHWADCGHGPPAAPLPIRSAVERRWVDQRRIAGIPKRC